MEARWERQAREKYQWITEAVMYMMEIKLFKANEGRQARYLAETLHYHSKDEGGEMMYTPKEAVDEELTYWGD